MHEFQHATIEKIVSPPPTKANKCPPPLKKKDVVEGTEYSIISYNF